jgi:hypothetical protein
MARGYQVVNTCADKPHGNPDEFVISWIVVIKPESSDLDWVPAIFRRMARPCTHIVLQVSTNTKTRVWVSTWTGARSSNYGRNE